MPLKIELFSFLYSANEAGGSIDKIAVEPRDLILDLT
jgi:hypothetical protein